MGPIKVPGCRSAASTAQPHCDEDSPAAETRSSSVEVEQRGRRLPPSSNAREYTRNLLRLSQDGVREGGTPREIGREGGMQGEKEGAAQERCSVGEPRSSKCGARGPEDILHAQ
eukprot:14353239-Alexandrium_andersonii.AAC.1